MQSRHACFDIYCSYYKRSKNALMLRIEIFMDFYGSTDNEHMALWTTPDKQHLSSIWVVYV